MVFGVMFTVCFQIIVPDAGAPFTSIIFPEPVVWSVQGAIPPFQPCGFDPTKYSPSSVLIVA
ncbi:MAG: hypothetical protein WDM90_23815 [Ferruginibacter sp.]